MLVWEGGQQFSGGGANELNNVEKDDNPGLHILLTKMPVTIIITSGQKYITQLTKSGPGHGQSPFKYNLGIWNILSHITPILLILDNILQIEGQKSL